jgi:hypothetical protein
MEILERYMKEGVLLEYMSALSRTFWGDCVRKPLTMVLIQ